MAEACHEQHQIAIVKSPEEKILLNDSIDSWREATNVNIVRFLKRATPSAMVGIFPA